MRRLAGVLAVALLTTACAQPVAPPAAEDVEGVAPTVDAVEPSPLAVPVPVPVSPADETDAAPAPATTSATPTPGPTTASPSPAPAPSPSPSPSVPRAAASPGTAPTEAASPTPTAPELLLAVADRTDDHGVQGPAWADLASVELAELGNDLRVTLRMAGDVPASPPEDEVPLLGVDIGDDGYQLFVDGGGPTGEWAAYLDTPGGLRAFPGTFMIAGRAIVLQLGFNQVGSPTRAGVRVFVEWSGDGLVLNPVSEDRLDEEPHVFDRSG